MDTLLFLCLLSVAFTGLTKAVGILPDDPLTAAVGDTVTFSTTLNPSQTQITYINWIKDSTSVVTYSEGGTIPGPDYRDRITLSPNSAALELRSVTLKDSGVYKIDIENNGTRHVDNRTLDVYVRVSDVVAVSNATQLVEFSSSVSLTCTSSGSALSFLWLNVTSEVTDSDRVQITDGGSTLIITTVTRYDHGPFTCHVSNPVSNGSSNQLNLSISYPFGPDNVTLTVFPRELYHLEGSDVILSCVADSKPAAQFDWYLNGEKLFHSGPDLRLNNIQQNQTGNYSCRAFNEQTLIDQTSPASAIHVLEKISGASIKASENLLEGKSVNLSCEGVGSIFSRTWLKDGSPLILDKNMSLHKEDRVLHFQHLQKTNNGEYSCTLSNPISHEKATYTMIINYGPLNVIIKGPSDVKEKEDVVLICSADSTPCVTYTWMLNGTQILTNFNVFTIAKADLNHSGNYICQARNPLTQNTVSAQHRLTVTALPEDPPASLSPGAIAGITVACLAVAGLVAGVGFYIFLKIGSSKGSTSENTRHDGMDSIAYEDIGPSKGRIYENTRHGGMDSRTYEEM
ncbi:carcinoembryonic antigen-related cell adhesion molecule 1-like [Thalassophryne amazonica]|uniref:carcinoembryonic antigen-related cell adhesion molecule 1-like n=1 Tax=Thalassophryne amazonica TaxID=390379 RepID=UPI001470EB60|nr:carcinoembryonic antigen-related cell adhesion molecule 1-like [Thalassophryne amazonica]